MQRVWRLACVTAASFCLAAAESAVNEQTVLRAGQSDVRTPVTVKSEDQRTLRICNAFAGAAKLEIKSLQSNLDLGELKYKNCKDHQLSLGEGDQLQFKAMEPAPVDVGTFAVAGMPKTSSAPLLLIVSNKKNHYTTATFKSHAFGEPADGAAQVAVVDTYVGESGNHSLRIRDDVAAGTTEMAEQRVAEDLPFNAVVAVSPGSYNVELSSSSEDAIASSALRAGANMNYVVMRVGGSGDSPEEVVVYPQSAGYRFAPLSALLLCLWFLQ